MFYLNFLPEKMSEGVRPDSLEKLQQETSQPTQVIDTKGSDSMGLVNL